MHFLGATVEIGQEINSAKACVNGKSGNSTLVVIKEWYFILFI